VGQVNRNLAHHETLKKILLVPDESTADDGTLTPTLKTRRRAIEVRYRKLIEELFEEFPRPKA
jgi:long-chain acyl-CoA synthetase